MRRIFALATALVLAGCATTPLPYAGQGPHPQITRGRPIAPIDGLGNVFAVLTKIILWNRKMDNHHICARTEDYLVRYIDLPETITDGTHYSLNEYNPGLALSRLAKNKKVKWPYRILLGIPVTLIVDVLIPGRLFAGLLNGDMYNPYTDTVSLYTDIPSVALHEAGHSHDFNKRRFKGTYALIRIIPGVDLFQEYKASEQAFVYLTDTHDHHEEIEAYKILFPAYADIPRILHSLSRRKSCRGFSGALRGPHGSPHQRKAIRAVSACLARFHDSCLRDAGGCFRISAQSGSRRTGG